MLVMSRQRGESILISGPDERLPFHRFFKCVATLRHSVVSYADP